MAESVGVYSVGEKVQVPFTGGEHYNAKILKTECREGGMWYYFIHYIGWNKQWDEWVEETGLIKCADAGTRSRSSAQGQKKRKLDEISGTVADPPKSMNLDLDLPPTLKQQLIKEHEIVVEQGRKAPLPRQPCVHDILNQFRAQAQGMEDLDGVVEGLKSYFDKALPLCLLYEREATECEKHLVSGVCPAFIWGAEHLLRLFVKLPELLAQTSITAQQLQKLQSRLQDVMAFLLHNQEAFFLTADEYESRGGL